MLRRLLEEHGFGRVWTSLAIAICLAGGGLVYQQVSTGDGTQACPAFPSFPDASCTGVPSGTSLTTHSGVLEITTNGATVDAMDVTGDLWIDADNVTVQNSRVHGIVLFDNHTGLTVQDTEIDCGDDQGSKGFQAGEEGGGGGDPASGFTATRMDVHSCEDAFFVGSSFTVQDSYIHDPTSVGADPHNDGFQIFSGSNVTIQHNSISWRDTSDIQFCNNLSCDNPSNVLVTQNYLFLAAGGAFNIYCPQVSSTNFVVSDNAFDENSGGVDFTTDCGGETLTGNYLYPSGDPYP